MRFAERSTPETIAAWRAQVQAELQRLRGTATAELAAEVLRVGFARAGGTGERTAIGLANSLCPEPPPGIGGDDVDDVHAFGRLLGPALARLEAAGLLTSERRGRSGLQYYRLTPQGEVALADHSVEAMLVKDRTAD
ncbi:MAG TPA: PadR family transcriptional regulator [Solirubrobacteraceae bacterium]|nr:PadR family transcriptional regulator [Solirubrobacteraceae bacterium]